MREEFNYQERKEWARLLYTKHDKAFKDIALTVGVDEAMLRNWADQDGWDGIKRSLLISKATQLENLYGVLEFLDAKIKSDGVANTKDVDMIVKYTTAIKNLEVETNVTDIIEVFELFVQWMRRRDHALTKKFIVHLDAFVKQKLAA